MTLFDEAILKAYGQKRSSAKRSSGSGPHFRTVAENETDRPQDEEQDSSSSRLLEFHVTDLTRIDEPQVDVPLVPPTQPKNDTLEVMPTHVVPEKQTVHEPEDDHEQTVLNLARFKWTDLRHEVTTENPGVHDWQIPDPEADSDISLELDSGAGKHDILDMRAPTESDADDQRQLSARDRATDLDARTALVPSWEVDRFQLPRICEQIEQDLSDSVQQAAQKVLDTYNRRRPVVTVGSWTRGEGRTTVAIVLARALARAGLSVALVDADNTAPALAQQLGLATDVLDEQGDSHNGISERCIRSLEDGFTLVSLTTAADETASIEDQLDEAVESLRGQYEIILIDQPAGRSDLCASTAGLHVVVRGAWGDDPKEHDGVPVRLVDNFVHADH